MELLIAQNGDLGPHAKSFFETWMTTHSASTRIGVAPVAYWSLLHEDDSHGSGVFADRESFHTKTDKSIIVLRCRNISKFLGEVLSVVATSFVISCSEDRIQDLLDWSSLKLAVPNLTVVVVSKSSGPCPAETTSLAEEAVFPVCRRPRIVSTTASQFRTTLAEVLDTCVPKRIRSEFPPLQPAQWWRLLKQLLTSGHSTSLATCVDAVTDAEIAEAKSTAFRFYISTMHSGLGESSASLYGSQELLRRHSEVKVQALHDFRNKVAPFGGCDSEELLSEFHRALQSVKHDLKEKALQECERIIKRLLKPLSDQLLEGKLNDTTLSQWQESMTAVIRQYDEEAPMESSVRNSVLLDVLLQWYIPNTSVVHNSAQQRLLKDLRVQTANLQRSSAEIESLRNALENAQNKDGELSALLAQSEAALQELSLEFQRTLHNVLPELQSAQLLLQSGIKSLTTDKFLLQNTDAEGDIDGSSVSFQRLNLKGEILHDVGVILAKAESIVRSTAMTGRDLVMRKDALAPALNKSRHEANVNRRDPNDSLIQVGQGFESKSLLSQLPLDEPEGCFWAPQSDLQLHQRVTEVELNKCIDELRTLRQQRDSLLRREKELSDKVSGLNEELTALSHRLVEDKTEAERSRAVVSNLNASLSDELRLFHDREGGYLTTIKALEAERDELRNIASQNAVLLADLRNVSAAHDENLQQLASTEAGLRDALTAREELANKVSHQSKELLHLQSQVSTYSAEWAATEKNNGELLQQLQDERRERDMAVNRYETTIADLIRNRDTTSADLQAAQGSIQELSKRLQGVSGDLQATEAKLDTVSRQESQLRMEIEKWRAFGQEKEQTVRDRERDIQMLTIQLTQVSETASSWKSRHDLIHNNLTQALERENLLEQTRNRLEAKLHEQSHILQIAPSTSHSPKKSRMSPSRSLVHSVHTPTTASIGNSMTGYSSKPTPAWVSGERLQPRPIGPHLHALQRLDESMSKLSSASTLQPVSMSDLMARDHRNTHNNSSVSIIADA